MKHFIVRFVLSYILLQHVLSSVIWSKISTALSAPTPRTGHSSVTIGNNVYIFGGSDLSGNHFNSLFRFNYLTETWYRVRATGDVPAPRMGHAAVAVRGEMVVFGGENDDGDFNDVFKFNPSNEKWEIGMVTGIVRPCARSGHAYASDGSGKIYIFGGYARGGLILNDLWEMDIDVLDPSIEANSFLLKFRKLSALSSSEVPTDREHSSLIFLDDTIYLFGGYGSSGVADPDVWSYNVQKQEWIQRYPPGSTPSKREGQVIVRNGYKAILMGGCDVTKTIYRCYSDVWSFDFKSFAWELLSNEDEQGTARELHSGSLIPGGKLIFIGGSKMTARLVEQNYKISGLDPCPSNCSGHGKCFENFFCICDSGWSGIDCLDKVYCPFNCSGNGSCSADGVCSCKNGFFGPACFTFNPCPNGCSGHGSCSTLNTCMCNSGYFGDSCEYAKAVSTEPAANVKITKGPPKARGSIKNFGHAGSRAEKEHTDAVLEGNHGDTSTEQNMYMPESTRVSIKSESHPTLAFQEHVPPSRSPLVTAMAIIVSCISGFGSILTIIAINKSRRQRT